MIAVLVAVLTALLGRLDAYEGPSGQVQVSSAVRGGEVPAAGDGHGADSAEPVRGPGEGAGERHAPPAAACGRETGGSVSRPRTPVPATALPVPAAPPQRYQGRSPPH